MKLETAEATIFVGGQMDSSPLYALKSISYCESEKLLFIISICWFWPKSALFATSLLFLYSWVSPMSFFSIESITSLLILLISSDTNMSMRSTSPRMRSWMSLGELKLGFVCYYYTFSKPLLRICLFFYSFWMTSSMIILRAAFLDSKGSRFLRIVCISTFLESYMYWSRMILPGLSNDLI